MTRGLWFVRSVAAILCLSMLAGVAEALMSITRAGCGQTKVCVESPKSCDPSGSAPCLFTSAAVNQSELSVGLRGESEGYIALGLQHVENKVMSAVFVCAQNGSQVFLRTMLRNNSDPAAPLTPMNMSVSQFMGSLNGSVISCSFSVPVSNVTKGSTNYNFTLQLGTGTVDRGLSLGVFNISHTDGPLDLMNLRNEPTTTTAPTTTPSPAMSITRAGCGQTKLCVEIPVSCDPNGNAPCLFTSAAVNQSELSVGLRGESVGYIALGLTSSTQEMSWFFVCGKMNGSFFFQTAQRNNSVQNAPLTKANISAAGVRGEVSGNVTKCVFKIQGSDLETKTRSANSSGFVFGLILGTGAVNGTALGSLTEVKKTPAVNLSNPSATIAPPTGGAGGTVAPLCALILPILLYTALLN